MQPWAGSMRKSMTNEECEDRKEHESKMVRLVGDLIELSGEMICAYLDAATPHERL